MDSVRSKVSEHTKNRNRKLIFGLLVVIILVAVAVLIENQISARLEDVEIMKNEISEEKAEFIKVKQLDTNIIAVKATDGSYRLAFDDCLACYQQYGVHSGFKNNYDNTGLVCKKCKSEVMYDEISYLHEESLLFPIYEVEIESLEDRFVLSAEYLETQKKTLEQMRDGNYVIDYNKNIK